MSTLTGYKGKNKQSPPERTPDTLRSKDVVEMVLGVSEGEISGLKDNSARNFLVGDTPLLNSSGQLNFSDFELLFFPGSGVNEKIRPALGGTSSGTTVNTTLASQTPVVRTGQQTQINYLELRLAVPQLYKQTENGDVLENTLDLLVEYKPTGAPESEWARAYWEADNSTPSNIGIPGQNWIRYSGAGVDPANPENGANLYEQEVGSTYEGDLAPSDPDLNDVWVDTSGATKVIKQWDGDSWEVIGNQPGGGQDFTFTYKGVHDVDYFNDLTRSTTGPQLSRGQSSRNTGLAAPSATNDYARVWDERTWRDHNGGRFGSIGQGNVTINGKTTSPYVKEIRWPVEAINDTYDIRVTKYSIDPGQGGDTENFIVVQWESFQEIVVGDAEYDNTACIQLVAQATDQFNGIPEISGIYDGLIVRVPSNYDPVARTYSGIWDGTWKLAFTNNPAFIWNELQLNTRWGRSAYYPVTPNKWDVYEAGKYCDEMVDDGQGGTQPRWTFNQWITDAQGVKKLSRYLAGVFNAAYADDGNGGVFLRVDKDDPARGIITPEDVHDGEINYSRMDIDTRVNEVSMTFLNPDLNYNEDRVRVVDQNHIDKYGRSPIDLVAFGCRNRHEALRRARARMIQSTTEVTTATFTTTRKGFSYDIFDIILIADAKLGHGVTGRAKSYLNVDKTHWELRDPITIEAGVDYFVNVQIPNPNYPDTESNAVTTVRYPLVAAHPTGEVTELELDGAALNIPDKVSFALEAAGYTGVPKPFRILGFDVQDGDPDKLVVTLLEVNRNKYSYIDTGVNSGTIEYTDLKPNEIEPPLNVKFYTEERIINGEKRRVLDIVWDRSKSKFATRYRIDYSRNGGSIQNLTVTSDLTAEFIEPPTGDFEFFISAVNILGRESNPVRRTYSLVGDYTPVDTPTGLRTAKGPSPTSFAERDAILVWSS